MITMKYEVFFRLREIFCLNTAIVIKLNILAMELEATEIRKVMEVSYVKESKSQNYFTSSLQSTVYIKINQCGGEEGRG